MCVETRKAIFLDLLALGDSAVLEKGLVDLGDTKVMHHCKNLDTSVESVLEILYLTSNGTS